MPRTTTWLAAAAATTALLAGGLGGAPAFADTPTPTPTASSTPSPTSTPAPVTATIDLRYGATASTVTVTDPGTVGQAIAQLRLKVDGDDRVEPGRSTEVTNGMTLTIDVVSVKKTVKKETVKYRTVKKKTSSLMRGQTRTTRAGRTGKVTITRTTTSVNGRTTKVVTRTTVDRKVRDKIVLVGTNRLNLARTAQWDRIARCESGGNWHIDTGNGYYGGLQFNLATWASAGGRKYSVYPNNASKDEQIDVANALYAKRGFQPWSCKP